MTHCAVFVLSLVGFVLLMLATARHQQDWLKRKLPAAVSKALRLGGFGLLAAGFVLAGFGLGWGYGTVCWCGWMTLAAGLVITANSNHARLTGLAGNKRS